MWWGWDEFSAGVYGTGYGVGMSSLLGFMIQVVGLGMSSLLGFIVHVVALG